MFCISNHVIESMQSKSSSNVYTQGYAIFHAARAAEHHASRTRLRRVWRKVQVFTCYVAQNPSVKIICKKKQILRMLLFFVQLSMCTHNRANDQRVQSLVRDLWKGPQQTGRVDESAEL